MLPPNVLYITTGYDPRCYWFELFECTRKIASLLGPLAFPIGSVEQRSTALIISFVFWGALLAFRPYENYGDDLVARSAQLTAFTTLIAAMLLASARDYQYAGILDALLVLTLSISIALGIAGEFGLDGDVQSLFTALRNSRVLKLLRALQVKLAELLDAWTQAPRPAVTMRPTPLKLQHQQDDTPRKGKGTKESYDA